MLDFPTCKYHIRGALLSRVLFAAESHLRGHPDKLADQISDLVLDSYLRGDPEAKVACETVVSKEGIFLFGEVKSVFLPNFEEEISKLNLSLPLVVKLHTQAPELSEALKRGANDQVIAIGYACQETPELMPKPIQVAREVMHKLEEENLGPDGKVLAIVEYERGQPVRLDTLLISVQHPKIASVDELRDSLTPLLTRWLDSSTRLIINPLGPFIKGGVLCDTGLTGRKSVSDAYGPQVAIGGGAFSGKDGSKLDRTAAYMARHIAKNLVNEGLARKLHLSLSYGIAIPEPLNIEVETYGTATLSNEEIVKEIYSRFPLTTEEMIPYLEMKKPRFLETAHGGHFGQEGEAFTWERLL